MNKKYKSDGIIRNKTNFFATIKEAKRKKLSR